MKYSKIFVCFANSRKMSGRCVAGKEWLDGRPGSWVRAVSDRPTRELRPAERHYENGREPQLLDLIDVQFKDFAPLSHQSENHVIDARSCWVNQG
jgi:hypothetical protein